MSTDFRPRERLLASELFDGRLNKFGIHEESQADQIGRMLIDAQGNFVFVWIDKAGYADEFTRYMGLGDPTNILSTVAEIFDTEIFSEHQRQYWEL